MKVGPTPSAPPNAFRFALPAASHPYANGVWEHCADAFRTSDDPQRDIARLSLLCAPYQGMQRLGRTWFGSISANGISAKADSEAPRERRSGLVHFQLAKGQCARVFATTDAKVAEWTLEILGPSSETIGWAKGMRGYAIANPKGAMCVNVTGHFRALVQASRGQGLAAVEVWTLPAK